MQLVSDILADDEMLMSEEDGDTRRRPILLYNGDEHFARRLLLRSWRRTSAICVAATGFLLLGALAAATVLAPRGLAAPDAAHEELYTKMDHAADKAAERDGESEDDENTTTGCCSWDNTRCGKVHGRCRGGVKQCEFCRGQWIYLPQSLCEKGHSLEKPLPRIWNYTSHGSKHARLKVLSYNLYWWKLFDKLHGGGKAGHLIKESAKDEPYDVMGFQECNQPYQVLWDAGLDGQYTALHTYINICIAWRTKVWELLEHGHAVVAQDASWGGPGQNYGQRMAMWVRLQHKETNETIFFMNHHGPLPLSSGGDWGAPATARKLVSLITRNATEGEPVVLVGDFNSRLHSLTVQQVGCRLFRVISGTKFGGIDHVFTNLDRSHVVSAELLGQGGSDHNALNAILDLGGAAAVHV